MGKHAPFGRPGALDRLRLWWHAKERSFRVNSLLAVAVGAVTVGLLAAALSRDPAPSNGLVNATRPHLTTGTLPNPPATVDIRAAGGAASPLALPDESTSTSSTVATVPPLPAAGSTPPRVVATTSPPAAATVPTSQATYREVPVPPVVPDASPPPLPSTTRPPTSVTTVPPSTPPSTASTSTTAVTLLPPIQLPPLLP